MENNMKPAVSKGKVSVIHDGGATVTVKPYTGDVVTPKLVVPFFLLDCLKVGMEVVYATFEDNTGVVMARMDGEWNHDLKGYVRVEENVYAADLVASVSFNGHTHTAPDGVTSGPQ